MPESNPVARTTGEDEPLLGRVGDASQPEGKPLLFNLVIGTAVIAQAGIWILTAIVWAAVFMKPLIFFSPHPVSAIEDVPLLDDPRTDQRLPVQLLNSAGVLLTTQAILVLQPTHTAKQKSQGTTVHSVLNGLGVDAMLAGLVIIEWNKISHGGTHFRSLHAILGLITYILFVMQALVGIAQYYTPSVFGSVSNAKKMYKYHRAGGYLALILSFATVAAATQTDYIRNVLHIKLWAVLVASGLVLVGILPRIKKRKLGL